MEHPPNKSIFVHKNGLSIVITVLRHNSIDIDVQRQGLSLLFYILSDDKQAKFHVKDARRTALALGAVTVIEAAQINFKNDSAVLDPCTFLMSFLAHEVESD